MFPVKGHECTGGGNVVAVGLVRSDADVSDAHLRFGNDGCGIFVLRSFEAPSHRKAMSVLEQRAALAQCASRTRFNSFNSNIQNEIYFKL